MAFWDKSPLAYKDKIVGIHADESQVEELREVYRKLTGASGCTNSAAPSMARRRSWARPRPS